MHKWKVGNFTLGIVFIAFGVAYIASGVLNKPFVTTLLNWWPLILILTGLEFLISSSFTRNTKGQSRHTVTNFFSLFLILIICAGAFAFNQIERNASGLNLLPAYSRNESNFTKNYSIQLQGVSQLVVDNELGNIQVAKGNGSNLEVQATITVRNNDEAYAKTLSDHVVQINEGSTTKISMAPELQYDRAKVQNIKVDYLIKVPGTLNIDLRCRFGSVKADNLSANLEIKNTNGPVTVDGITGNLSITNALGKVEARRIKGETVVRDQNSDVSISQVTGGIDVTNQFGDINAENVTGNAKVINTNGGINLSGITGDTQVENRFGNIELKKIYGAVTVHGENSPILIDNDKPFNKDVSIENQFGNITLKVPSTQTARFTAFTKFGTIHSDFDVNVTRGNNVESIDQSVGKATPSINLQNQNGNIEILNFKGASSLS